LLDFHDFHVLLIIVSVSRIIPADVNYFLWIFNRIPERSREFS